MQRKESEVGWGFVLIILSSINRIETTLPFKGSLTQLHSLLRPADVTRQLTKYHSPLSSG